MGAFAPRAFGPQDRAAKEPFAYVPPEGFVASEQAKRTLDGSVAGGTEIWVRPIAGPTTQQTPNVSLVRTAKQAPAEEADVAALAAGMPQIFANSGTTWRELRHGLRVRPDGVRVAFLEGAASRPGSDPYRVLQIAFPVNEGAVIATASFPEGEAAAYERDFDATIDAARGVAYRAPPPPGWVYGAWGIGGAVVALAVALAALRVSQG